MSRTIRFSIIQRKNGTLTDLTAIELTDSDNLFAIKRLDDDSIVLAPDDVTVQFTHDSTGRYSYTLPNDDITSIVLGIIYRLAAKLTYDNGDIHYRILDGIAAVGSSYVDYNKFIRKWTNKALIEVTDKEHIGLTSPDEDLINDAFIWAEAWINMLMGNGAYAVPLEFTGTVDPVVEEWVMVLAFARLYYDRWDDSAGDEIDLANANQSAKKIKSRVGQVLDEIALIKSGIGPQLTGATLSTEYDRTPSLLSPQDIFDANLSLMFAGSRSNIWT